MRFPLTEPCPTRRLASPSETRRGLPGGRSLTVYFYTDRVGTLHCKASWSTRLELPSGIGSDDPVDPGGDEHQQRQIDCSEPHALSGGPFHGGNSASRRGPGCCGASADFGSRVGGVRSNVTSQMGRNQNCQSTGLLMTAPLSRCGLEHPATRAKDAGGKANQSA